MRMPMCLVVVFGCMGLAEETKKEARCSSGYHECYYSGACIPNSLVCDGTENCYYGDDEDNCPTTTPLPTETTRENLCPEEEYQCITGICIPNTWVCDGTKDCPEYGDDEDCSKIDSIRELPRQLECSDNFDYIYDRCVLVDPFTKTTWDEARYLCEKFNSDLVVLDDYNFNAELLHFIRDKGLDSHSYWVGASDKAEEGTWLWVDGSPVSPGAPLWALYGCTGDYQLEPRPSDASTQDCGYLDINRGLYLSDGSCDEIFATICQATSGRKET